MKIRLYIIYILNLFGKQIFSVDIFSASLFRLGSIFNTKYLKYNDMFQTFNTRLQV